jgi:predicted transcriptional regulator
VDEIKTPTPREMDLLKVLWERGPCSVRDVFEALRASEPDLVFNTVQTLLRIMETKQLVSHEVEGRSFIYSACYSRDESAARFLDRVFDGAAAELVSSLLRSERLSPEELEEMQSLIAAARRSKNHR